MPELIVLAIVSLTTIASLVYLFVKLNSTQLELIKTLSEQNQSLLNQVRTTDISTLAGLNSMTGQQTVEEAYISTDDREMLAWIDSQGHSHEVGEPVYDEDAMEALRAIQ